MPDSLYSTVALAERAVYQPESLLCAIGNAYQGRALTQFFKLAHGLEAVCSLFLLLFLVFSLRS